MDVEISKKMKKNPAQSVGAVIFDCDGTLVDSENAHYLAWKHALQNQGDDLTVEEYYFFVGKSTETNAKLFSQKIGKNCAEEIYKDKLAHFHKLQAVGLPPIQATIDFIHRLAKEKKRLSLKLGVASAVGKEEIMTHLKHLGIENYFDIILSGSDDLHGYSDPEGVNKPKPYIYQHAAKILGVHPSKCVVIEDSSTGIAAGVDAGCITIAVPNSYSHKQDLSRAHLKIGSFDNISVDEFLQTIAELMV